MSLLRAFAAFLLALILFALAPKLDSNRPAARYFDARSGNHFIDHKASGLYRGTENPTMEVWAGSSFDSLGFDITLIYRQPNMIGYDSASFSLQPGTLDRYVAVIPRLVQGYAYEYFVLLRSEDGTVQLRLPADSSESIRLTFEGKPDLVVWALHIALMYFAALYAFLALFNSLALRISELNLRKLSRKVFITGLLMLIGSLFAGSLVSLSRFGYLWGGWPFGDNRAQTFIGLLILYWLGLTVIFRGTIFGYKPEKNLVSNTGALILTLLGVLFMIVVYLTGGHFVEIPL